MPDELVAGQQVELAVALICAGLAVWSLVPAPVRMPIAGAGWRPPAWLAWLAGRPDGVSRGFRTLVAIPAAVGIAVLCQGLGMPWWLAWAAGVVGAASGWVGLGQVEADVHRRRRLQLIEDLPAACDLLAVCLEAGLPLRRACLTVAAAMPGPVADDLDRVGALVASGTHEQDAWRTLAGDEPWHRLATDLARSVDSGAAVAAVLHHHAEEARVASDLAREVRARSAGVRSVLPLMVCFLPAFFLVGVVPLVAGLVLRMLE